MSTILKSLKKLEQENRGAPSNSPFSGYRGPGSLSSQGVKERWFKSVWLKRGFMACVIIVLGAASLYFYSQSRDIKKFQASLDNPARPRPESRPKKNVPPKPRRTPPPEADEIAPGIKNIAPRPVPPPVKKKPGPKRMTSQVPTAQRSAPPPVVSNLPSDASTAEASPSRKPVVRDENSSSNQSISQQPTRPKTPARPKAPPSTVRTPAKRSPGTDRVPPKAKEKPARKPASESFENVPVLSGGPLKVHAIVWSTVSEDRMAVINSKVLHEGDDVDGYTLVAIRPDDVVVKKSGGGRYRVLFGRP